jgi:hypothetical protein
VGAGILLSIGFTLISGIHLSAIWREWIDLPGAIASGPLPSWLEAVRRRRITFIIRAILVIGGNAFVFSMLTRR